MKKRSIKASQEESRGKKKSFMVRGDITGKFYCKVQAHSEEEAWAEASRQIEAIGRGELFVKGPPNPSMFNGPSIEVLAE